MLESLYAAIAEKSPDAVTAWDRMMEFLAVDSSPPLVVQMERPFDWLVTDYGLTQKVMSTYDRNLLRSEYHDHLGDMYCERFAEINGIENAGHFLLDSQTVQYIAQKTIPETKLEVTVVDVAAGTGKLLMAASIRAPNGTFFGVESDLRALRVALTNFGIHKVKGYLLHANVLQHETRFDREDGLYNWRFANLWDSHMDELRLLPHLNHGFNPLVN